MIGVEDAVAHRWVFGRRIGGAGEAGDPPVTVPPRQGMPAGRAGSRPGQWAWGTPESEPNLVVDVLGRIEIEIRLGIRVKARERFDQGGSISILDSLRETEVDSDWRGCVHYDV
jgi:hypothetical protein